MELAAAATTAVRREVTRPEYESLLLRARLRRRLLSLPFDAFARVASDLLVRVGYRDVRSAGRRSYRGRNQHSGGVFAGFDLVAHLPEPQIAGMTG